MCNNRKQVSEGHYYLGRWGWISNVAALAWVAFSLVLFCVVQSLLVWRSGADLIAHRSASDCGEFQLRKRSFRRNR